MTLGGDFATVLLGRVLMGAGHTLSMLAGITTVLRYRAGPGPASSLNAKEFSSMLGVLGGVALVAFLPRSVSWGTAFLLACVPVLWPGGSPSTGSRSTVGCSWARCSPAC